MLIVSDNRVRQSNAPDEALILRIAADDQRALASLYGETSTSVYAFILSIVKNSHTAEDLMQETYIQIYLAASSYKPQGKPMAWILTIARNLAFMKLREKSSADVSLDTDWSLRSEHDGIQQALDRLVLESAMRVLDENERQIIMLHDVAGLKHREIADFMQLPLATVLSKYRRALSKVRKQVQEEI